MVLYHGSDHVLTTPLWGAGNFHNDYGLGFYCTERLELAKEWACQGARQGFANEYNLDPEGLSWLDLSQEPYSVLNWLAVLLENRVFVLFQPQARAARDYLIREFLPPYQDFDVIQGYRADDSYFAFANAFLNNQISLQKLGLALKLGHLGEQIVLKSPAAFRHLSFRGALPVDVDVYGQKRRQRDRKARDEYRSLAAEAFRASDILMVDLLRDKLKADDARLR